MELNLVTAFKTDMVWPWVCSNGGGDQEIQRARVIDWKASDFGDRGAQRHLLPFRTPLGMPRFAGRSARAQLVSSHLLPQQIFLGGSLGSKGFSTVLCLSCGLDETDNRAHSGSLNSAQSDSLSHIALRECERMLRGCWKRPSQCTFAAFHQSAPVATRMAHRRRVRLPAGYLKRH